MNIFARLQLIVGMLIIFCFLLLAAPVQAQSEDVTAIIPMPEQIPLHYDATFVTSLKVLDDFVIVGYTTDPGKIEPNINDDQQYLDIYQISATGYELIYRFKNEFDRAGRMPFVDIDIIESEGEEGPLVLATGREAGLFIFDIWLDSDGVTYKANHVHSDFSTANLSWITGSSVSENKIFLNKYNTVETFGLDIDIGVGITTTLESTYRFGPNLSARLGTLEGNMEFADFFLMPVAAVRSTHGTNEETVLLYETAVISPTAYAMGTVKGIQIMDTSTVTPTVVWTERDELWPLAEANRQLVQEVEINNGVLFAGTRSGLRLIDLDLTGEFQPRSLGYPLLADMNIVSLEKVKADMYAFTADGTMFQMRWHPTAGVYFIEALKHESLLPVRNGSTSDVIAAFTDGLNVTYYRR